MEITIKTNFNLSKLNMGKVNQIGLVNSTQAIKKQAQDNAPYQTGKLRQGIGIEPGIITTSTKSAKIGPRKIVYAIRREFENKKNPHKKFYMRRAWQKADEIVKEKFTEAVNIVVKSI